MSDLSMWEWFRAHDVLTWLQPLWASGQWILNADNKLEPVKTQIAMDTPWIHHGHEERAECFIGQLLFNQISLHMKDFFVDGEPFVPSGCLDCYKVVVRPKTLTQLFALDELQEKLDHPAKCGIEVRPSVGSLYGGYFYNRGLEEGRECFEKIRKLVDENDYLGPTTIVILKRACTEMELAVGPSDKWEISEDQKVIEELVRNAVVIPPNFDKQPDAVIWRVKRWWIEWAYGHGDQTYKRFTGGKPITPAYITYHDEEIGDGMSTRMETAPRWAKGEVREMWRE